MAAQLFLRRGIGVSLGGMTMNSKSDAQKENEKAFEREVKNNLLEIGIYLAALRGKVKERHQSPEKHTVPAAEYAILSKHQLPAFREGPQSPVMVLDDKLNWAELPAAMNGDWDQSPKIKMHEWIEKVKEFLGEPECDIFDPDTDSFHVLTDSHDHLRNFFVLYRLAKYLLTNNQSYK